MSDIPASLLDNLLVQLNGTGLQQKDQKLYQFLLRLLGGTSQIQNAVTTVQNAPPVSSGVTVVTGTPPLASSGGTTPDISLNDTAVTPATYGDATHVGQFTVDQKGRLTFAQDVAITGATGIDHVVLSDGVVAGPTPVNDGAGNFIYVAY